MLAAPQATAWYHFRQAKSCLTQGRTREAQSHLAACQRIWPDRVSVHFLAVRAARQAGDFAAAEEHFARVRRLQPEVSPERAFEYALHCAAVGDLGQTESFLRTKIHEASEEGPLACEALAEGYVRNYRGPEALQVLDVWQERQPDNLHALKLRGDVWRHVEALGQATECYQRVLQLDPNHRKARHWLALCLLDGGRPTEAMPHWERLHADSPEDVEVVTHLARCRGQLGQTEQAERLLKDVLTSHPDHVVALRTHGQICLAQGRFADAESALRRAIRVAPRDYKANERLYQVLQRQGRTVEAEAQHEQVRALEANWKYFRKIVRDVAEHPQDPALLCEMGAALLDLGFEDVALGWLLSAVKEDPRCRRGHELLAGWYENHRDADRAAYHRVQARALAAASKAASP
jgi:predicted Zn-dependent protease